jgi:hypothetical protein
LDDLCFRSVAIQNHVLKLRNILNIGRKTEVGPSNGLSRAHDNRSTEETRNHNPIFWSFLKTASISSFIPTIFYVSAIKKIVLIFTDANKILSGKQMNMSSFKIYNFSLV